MKKLLLIPAVLLLIAGLLITCDMGGDWGTKKAPPSDKPEPPTPPIDEPVSMNLPASFQFNENFQYGHGYNYNIPLTGALGDIKSGQEYTLEIVFTLSRNLEDTLQVLLLDDSPAASYHKELSEYYIVDGGDGTDEDNFLVTGTTYTQTIEIVADDNFVERNLLQFSTIGASNHTDCSSTKNDCTNTVTGEENGKWSGTHGDGVLDTGKVGALTITFTKGTLTRTK